MNDIKKLVNYFFKIKGWDLGKKEYKIIYPRYVRSAEKLLELSDFYTIKWKLNHLKYWAESNGLDWSMDTLIKKWFEIDNLKIKEVKRKPHYKGDAVVERFGKLYVNIKGELLEFAGDKKDIYYK